MAIEVVPHTANLTPAVEAFNLRMREGGSQWGFYTDPQPDWIPYYDGAKTWREYHLALEDGETVRGGYALKPQQWLINGKIEWVTDWQGPFTEAAIDVKYSPLMLRLLRGMQKKHPLLFSLGHGGADAPLVELLRKMKWDLWGVPFSFFVCKPFRFLRFNRYLRESRLRRLVLDILAFSGLGWLAIRLMHWAINLTNPKPREAVTATVVAEFGEWADDLWIANKDAYSCLAVRDREMMNALMPQTGWPGGIRLQVSHPERGVIGWSIVHHKALVDDPRFGSLHAGLITDCFGAPDDAASVLAATHSFLTSQNVDLIFANLSHPKWVQGMRANGYVVLPDRRMFALAPSLQAALTPKETIQEGLHLTNMDGHGPHGFE